MNAWAVAAAVVTASASIVVLVINLIMSDRQKRRAKMLELALARCDEQISKFYAPLAMLVEQLDATDDLKKEMVLSDPEHRKEIEAITYKKYFLHIHQNIAETFKENLHLLEGVAIPRSFIEYHKHVASEKVFFSLVSAIDEAKKAGEMPQGAGASITCSPVPYPEPSFKEDIIAGRDKVLGRQEQILQLLDREIAFMINEPFADRGVRTERSVRGFVGWVLFGTGAPLQDRREVARVEGR